MNFKTVASTLFLYALLFVVVWGFLELGRNPTREGDVAHYLSIGIAVAFTYFVPNVLAYRKKHHNRGAIFALNVLLGWTVIG